MKALIVGGEHDGQEVNVAPGQIDLLLESGEWRWACRWGTEVMMRDTRQHVRYRRRQLTIGRSHALIFSPVEDYDEVRTLQRLLEGYAEAHVERQIQEGR